MRRGKKDAISEMARAEYQANLIDVVNDFLDAGFTRVDVEFLQHRGDLGHTENEISTFYAHINLPGLHGGSPDSQAWSHDRLHEVQVIAMRSGCNVSIQGDGTLVIWLPPAEKGT